jgi:hypothetical protein
MDCVETMFGDYTVVAWMRGVAAYVYLYSKYL